MENSSTHPVPLHWAGFGTSNQFQHRNDVINELSRAPVKVRHWLLMNDNFQAGLEALNPNSTSWILDERIRAIVKTGLVRMIASAVDFVCAFPDAQIPKV